MHRQVGVSYTPDLLAMRTGGSVSQWPGRELHIRYLLTDSRKLVYPEASVFFALGTGMLYVEELYQRGLSCFVLPRGAEHSAMPGACIISAEDPLRALQSLAAAHRSDYHYPVIGITGSNGKTIVKEWLHQLLSPAVRIVRSPKSYNSQIGVPLSVWQMGPEDELAIFEAGISLPGEMERLEPIIRPDIGIFTNLLDAHDEGFLDKTAKAREKYQLFRRCRYLVFCTEHTFVCQAVQEAADANPCNAPVPLSWGASSEACLRVVGCSIGGSSTEVEAIYAGVLRRLRIPFIDAASLENAMHAWMMMLHLKTPDDAIQERMAFLSSLSMRLALREAIHGCVLVDDSYSADLSSLRLALDFLMRQRRGEQMTVILSDILQSGLPPEQLYREVAAELMRSGVTRLLGIGPELTAQASIFEGAVARLSFYPDTTIFLEQFHLLPFRDEAVLLKGARSFGFERIAERLESRAHQTVLEIDLSAIAHNLRAHRRLLSPGVRLMAMVKAFSYGAGAFEVASLLQFHRVDWLAVAYTDEGAELRRAGIRMPILVMNPEPASFRLLTDYDLQPEIYSLEGLHAFDQHLQSEGLQGYPVHVKLETGMHRLGFAATDCEELGQFLSGSGRFRVVTAFSHLAAAEDATHDAFTRQQAEQFVSACDRLKEALGYDFLRHLSNTAGIRRHPGLQFEMVRIGIGLYGIDAAVSKAVGLRHALTLTTTVAQVRSVPSGESIGYGRQTVLDRERRIATLRIGYADGFPRSLGNGVGRVWIAGTPCPVVGQVCMDMTMVDVSDCPDIQAGAKAIVFGGAYPVTDMAVRAGTIPYELLTGISPRVRRVYLEE